MGTILFLLQLTVKSVDSASGLCKANVQLNLGVDPGMVGSSVVEALTTAFSGKRSSMLGLNVVVNIVSVPSTTEFPVLFNLNAQGGLPTTVHAIMLETNDVYQQESVPIDIVSFPIMGTFAHSNDNVVIYNLPNLTGTLKLTTDQIANIFMGNITTWDDAYLLHNNPSLAATARGQYMRPTVRLDVSSGTTIFTAGLSNGSTAWREVAGNIDGDNGIITNVHWNSPDSPGTQMNSTSWPTYSNNFYGYTDAGVAYLVQLIPYTIGYVTQTTALQYGMRYASIENLFGDYTVPTPESVSNAMSYSWQSDVGLPVEDLNASGTYRLTFIDFTDMAVYMKYTEPAC